MLKEFLDFMNELISNQTAPGMLISRGGKSLLLLESLKSKTAQ
jgi:hypothetical protein